MNGKKELRYFKIGNSYGGNQRWMIDPWMHIGGCAALTTCDAFIYLSLYKGLQGLCPYAPEKMGKKEYKKFAMSMKPYLQPRESGIKDLGTYMDGVRAYLEDVEEDRVTVTGLDGMVTYGNAEAAIRETIDREMPVAYLMLKHRDKKFDFFEWHWFLVIGYDESDGGFMIKVATYGKAHWLSLKELWDTGFDEKGGLVLFEADQTEKEERDKTGDLR